MYQYISPVRWPIAAAPCIVLSAMLSVIGCTEVAFLDATRPLSDGILINAADARVGNGQRRDDMGVGFINRTPYRAIGTFGGYDPQDEHTIVTFVQLGVAQPLDLEPNGVSRTYAMSATRAFTIGGQRLIQLIYDNNLVSTTVTVRLYPSGSVFGAFIPSTDLLNDNLGFTGAPFGDDQADVPTEGTAQALTAFIGTNYESNSILIFDLLQDDTAPGGFRIEQTTAEALGVNVKRLIILPPSERALLLSGLGLDRKTFQLLTALGSGSGTAGLFTIDPGTDPQSAEITLLNNGVQTVTVAFFGPDSPVVQLVSGQQRQFKVAPGTYEYLVCPSGSTDPVLFNTQVFNGGVAATLVL